MSRTAAEEKQLAVDFLRRRAEIHGRLMTDPHVSTVDQLAHRRMMGELFEIADRIRLDRHD